MYPEGWDKPTDPKLFHRGGAPISQESTAALTGDLQAVPELGHSGHVGGHAAVAATVGEPGTGDLQALPIPGQGQRCPG